MVRAQDFGGGAQAQGKKSATKRSCGHSHGTLLQIAELAIGYRETTTLGTYVAN